MKGSFISTTFRTNWCHVKWNLKNRNFNCFTCVQCWEDYSNIEQQAPVEFRSCLQQLPLKHGHHILYWCWHLCVSSEAGKDRTMNFRICMKNEFYLNNFRTDFRPMKDKMLLQTCNKIKMQTSCCDKPTWSIQLLLLSQYIYITFL